MPYLNSLNPDEAKRARLAFNISIAATIVAVFSSIQPIILVIQYRNGLAYSTFATNIVTIIGIVISAAIIRWRNYIVGTWLLIGAALFAFVTRQLFVADSGVLQGITTAMIATLLAVTILPASHRTRANIVGVIGSVVIIFLDTFFPFPYQRLTRTTVTQQTVFLITQISLNAILLAALLRQYRDFSLNTKLITAFLVVTLIPIGGLTYYNDFTSRQTLTKAAIQALKGAAVQTANNLDGFIKEGLVDIRTDAQLTILKEYLALSPAERAGSKTETVLIADLRAISRRDQIFISSVALIDKNGLAVADTDATEVGKDKSDRTYFRTTLTYKIPNVSPIVISNATRQASFYFSAPVRDVESNIIGVIRVRYNAAVLQQLVKASSAGFDGVDSFAVLLDENNVRLAHSLLPELVLKSVMPLPAEKLAKLQTGTDPRLPTGTAEELSTNLPGFQQALDNLDAQPQFETEFAAGTGAGPEQAVGIRLANQPWVIVFAQTKAAFLEPVESQTRTTTLIAFIIAALVTAIGFFLAQLITRPIVQLTSVAQRVADGDLNAQATITTQDEVGVLGTTFNAMTVQLRQSLEDVRERARAVELSSQVSRRLSTILEQAPLVKEVVEQVKSAFGYYHVHIYLFDEVRERLIMMGGTGEAGKTLLTRGHNIPSGKGLVGRAATSNSAVLVPNTSADSSWLPNPLLPETKSEAALPIALGDRVLGVLDVQHNVVNGLKQSDIDVLQTVANQVAIALQNAQSYATTQARARHEQVLREVTAQVRASSDVDVIMRKAVQEVGRTLGRRVFIKLGNER